MKVIKIIHHNGVLHSGNVYCVHNFSTTPNNDLTLYFFDFVVDTNGTNLGAMSIESKHFVDVVGDGRDSVFNNPDMEYLIRDLASAFREGQSVAPIKDYEEQQKDREMADFFREMKMMMQSEQSERWNRENQERQDQLDKLDKQIVITPYSEEEKGNHYLMKGIESKMKVVYKNVS